MSYEASWTDLYNFHAIYAWPRQELELTIAIKDGGMSILPWSFAKSRFYRDPLQKVDFICSKTVILIFSGIKISENKKLSTKTYVDKSNFS